MHTEDEDLIRFMGYWKRYGKPVLLVIVLLFAGLFAEHYWNQAQQTQAQQASMLYQQIANAVVNSETAPDLAQISKLVQKMNTDYPATAYAQYSTLLLVKVSIESGKLSDAQASLQALVNKPVNDDIAELARQRLARVMAAQNHAQQALDLLSTPAPVGYAAQRLELKGDLLLQLNRQAEALEAYKSAQLPQADSDTILQMKIDALTQGDI